MSDPVIAFQLVLPYQGPVATGRLLLDEIGTNGSRVFVVDAGSPFRLLAVPSLPEHHPTTFERRRKLVAEGDLIPSATHVGYLEATRDIRCGSPFEAATLVCGVSTRAQVHWRTVDGTPLGHFM